MTKYQQKIFDALKRGGRLEWNLSGYYYNHKLLRVETSDALIGTKELVLVRVKGKRITADYVVHFSRVGKFVQQHNAAGREILLVVDPFLGKAK